MEKKKRILTGDRPTGNLHLGHYLGSLQNRARLQDEYDTFIIIADVQALTTNFDRPEKLSQDVMNVALDNLSVGIDPEKATIFIQSYVPEIAELTVYYGMLATVNTLRHNPTVKTEIQQYGYKDVTYGFLGYPVSQAADITFCKADLVPVGEDQLPHLELTRKIVRRFNELYSPVLVEPQALLSSVPRLVGLDGNSKMGKSLGNGIYLRDEPQVVRDKIFSAVTDTNRIRATDKGNPGLCTVFTYHGAFNSEESPNIKEMCEGGSIGCVACKKNLASALERMLVPIRERRKFYEDRPDKVGEIIRQGTERARSVARVTMQEIRAAMKIDYTCIDSFVK